MSELAGHSQLLGLAIEITVGLILAGAACAFARMVIGPTLPDRVVSVDLITVLAVTVAGLIAVATNVSAFIDVAFALALVAFLATVAFAWYAEQRAEDTREADRLREGSEDS